MPRARQLHKDTGGIAVDEFHGVNTQRHRSKLQRGELAVSLNNTSRFGDLRKEHGWGVVNNADLTAAGGAQSRMTDDKALFTGGNAASVTGVYPYRYTQTSAAAVQTSAIAICDKQVYGDLRNTSFLPTGAAYQLHSFSGTGQTGDLPVFAEWDGFVFFSIGRETTSAAWSGGVSVDSLQVYDPDNRAGAGAGVHDFKVWWDALGSVSFLGADVRPLYMAINWGWLILGRVYDKTNTAYEHNTIYYIDLNTSAGTPATTWGIDILGDGGDRDASYINGMIAFGDHVFCFTRHGHISRLSYLTDINNEGINLSSISFVEDKEKRIAYQNGCAAGHSLVLAGQRLLWLADDGVWMLEHSESLLPVRVSEKLDGFSGIWANVNKDAIEGACATYDLELRQVLFSVPYGASTKNNKVIVAQLPEDEYQAADYRTWNWSVRDRCAASIAYDPDTRTILWGQSVASGLLCEDDTSAGQGGETTDTNEAATGVSYTSTVLTDTGQSWTADELIGMPVTVKYAGTGLADTTWIGDNAATTLTWDTDMALSATPSANDEYRIGGLHWSAILNEEQFEDEMFFGTGFVRMGVTGGNATVQSEIYVDSETNPTVKSHALAAPGVVPVAVPFAVGGQAEVNEKIYADKRTSVVAFGFRDIGYSGVPKVIRIDMPTKRINRTRRR